MTNSFSHQKHTSNIYYKEMIDLLQGAIKKARWSGAIN